MVSNPYQKYQQLSVQTASPAQLLLMLYDGAIRFVKQGVDAIEQGHVEKANISLIKAQNIVHELMAALDFQYSISNDLVKVYEYMLHQLIQANVKKDTAPALEVLSFLVDLKDSWMQASKPASAAKEAIHG
ncbi:flagellar export chaperone FliS [Paenibacillus lycopersici]|uniref:Flagellar secretion chaperone FliS n=1 Tax=Paenibacillus lycopersici TaxID=2704462 RepID=A0A6C0G8V8_9BACL|nr:flagellar export chaperone FliS [Paenibacillus lycopersici]QHT64173.1 flagellar export chaperone FliS [Paenibacillus lycopersici]